MNGRKDWINNFKSPICISLDSNTIINYLDASLPASAMLFMHTIVNEFCNISIISKMEVLGHNFTLASEQKTVEAFVAGSIVLVITDDVVNKTIEIRKEKKLKLPDAIIAATALTNGLTLISRNLSDFKNITGLVVIDPFTL